MNVVENTAAGLIVAVLVWLARWARTWWQGRTSPPPTPNDHTTEQQPMGRPLKKPDLPPGAHRALNDRLHELHRRANFPSLRDFVDDAPGYRGKGRSSLYNAMSGLKLPTKDAVAFLGLKFADRIRWGADADAEAETERIDRELDQLWEAADREAHPPQPDSVECAAKSVWEDLGTDPDIPGDVRDAIAKATFVTAEVRGTDVTVWVAAPDEASYFVLDGQVGDISWRGTFGTALGRRVGAIVDVAVFAIEDWNPSGDAVGPAAPHASDRG
ncbi:hypothetical protein [Streptomyces sp. NPDC054975]